MASNPPKQSSRWGSLLSGAVAGLESRLDTILGEDDQASARTRAAEEAAREAARQKKAAEEAQKKTGEQGLSRTGSKSRTDSRLQDRLARALAAKAAEQRPSSRTSMDVSSSPALSPKLPPDSSRASMDSKLSESLPEPAHPRVEEPQKEETAEQELNDATKMPPDATSGAVAPETILTVPRISTDSPQSQPATPSLDISRAETPLPEFTTSEETSYPPIPDSPTQLKTELIALRETHSQAVSEHRSEIHSHLERVDALQNKLTYLAKQLAEASKANAEAAPGGGLDKKVAEKDAQIAALMEEGQKLSKNELKHLGVIKKLRAKLGESERESADLKKRLAKAEQSSKEERERAERAEAAEKAAQEKLKIVARIERDVDVLQAEKEAAGVMIADLRRQLSDAITRAEQAESQAQTEALEAERRTVAELKDEIADLKIEKKLVEDRAKAEVRDIKEDAARQAERAKVTEVELKGEIANLEAKLEVLRTRSEEVSSTSDSTTKLLRQIETLQTQYALASENWQGIESTLTSRVAALEKERDDVAKRESDVRRKAREVNSKARKLEDELETVADRARALEQDLLEQRDAVQKMQARASQAESALQEAKERFETQKKAWDAEMLQKLEEEKAKWRLENVNSYGGHSTPTESHFLRADSPGYSVRKHSATDLAGLHTRRGRIPSELALPLMNDRDRPPSSRRTSTIPRTPDIPTPQRQDSNNSLSLNGYSISQAPSLHTLHDEPEAFDTISSPQRTIPDLISSSTRTGPSVQLVERMSAAVRRLESEKAASKEELARLTAQRDEARGEVVSLMREAEEKKKWEEKAARLEAELQQMNQRYETTLEMLGEKSEQVDELKNDVADLKKIYRDLVERTLK